MSLVRFLSIVIAISIVGGMVVSQQPVGQEIDWIRQMGSDKLNNDHISGVSAQGDIYVAGTVVAALPGQTHLGSGDAYARKYDALGNEVWTRQFGTYAGDLAKAVSVTTTGVYVAGETNGSFTSGANSGLKDIFIRKFDLDGTVLWTTQFGSSNYDYVTDLTANSTGVFVTGHTKGALPGNVYSGGHSDAFVSRVLADGTIAWIHQFGDSDIDTADDASANESGVYVVGYVRGPLPGQTQQAALQDAYIRRYENDGSVTWTDQYALHPGGWAASATKVVASPSGVYVTGYWRPFFFQEGDCYLRKYSGTGVAWTIAVSESLWIRDLTTASTHLYVVGTGGGGVTIRSYDVAGSLPLVEWTQQFQAAGSVGDTPTGVATDGASICVVGQTTGSFPGYDVPPHYSDAFVRRCDLSGNELWTRQFGTSSPGADQANAVDCDGNIYVIGDSEGNVSGQVAASGAVLRKYDQDGNEIWVRQFATGYSSYLMGGTGVATDSSGVYVCGRVSGALPGQISSGSRDGYLRKYDHDGYELWTQQFGTPYEDACTGIALDGTAIFVTGSTYGEFPGETQSGNYDAFVGRFDTSGAPVWIRQFGSSKNDYPRDIAVSQGGLYVVGYTYGLLAGVATLGYYDAFIRNYDSDGNEVWTRQFGSAPWTLANGVAALGTQIYVVGYTGGYLTGSSNAGGADLYIRKYDATGLEIWTTQEGTAASDYGQDVCVDTSGIFVSGHTFGTLPNQTRVGHLDILVQKYDHSGVEIWTHQFGTPRADHATGISACALGVTVSGYTYGDFLNGTLPAPGRLDAFVAKLRPEDSDGDGLSDADELSIGTDPLDDDTDDDGLLDGTEVEMADGTGCPDPLNPDSDGDTLSDGDEVANGTSPCDPDTDDDGCADNVDPWPLIPGVTLDMLQQLANALADSIMAPNKDCFDAPNDNARKGRRNSLANRARNAGKDVGDSDIPGAIDKISSLIDKVDGIPKPKDWMVTGTEKTQVHTDASTLLCLLNSYLGT